MVAFLGTATHKRRLVGCAMPTELKETPNRIHTVRKSPHFVDPINDRLPRVIGSAGRQRKNPKDQKQKSDSFHF
ncbi:MAG: hypothetical protein CMO60_08340 [Verrucomicrobiales bacterium]|nr:hypothetical protein [Verrucomicrobiales bacterium]